MQEIHKILKQYWGFDTFRPLQEEIIRSVSEGKDVLALLPTGGGKSICYQVPAMAQNGICLVVSPLIALMKDQVQNLQKKGIPALSIYSGMSFIEVKKTLQNAVHGNYKFLYVSPERLETNLFLEYLPAMKISLIAVDEAHCVSQWGYDFRPPYLRISKLREYLPSVPVLALTASATKEVQDDICDKLLFSSTHKRYQQSFERPNLSYSVFNVAAKQNKLLEILQKVKGSAIVYCKNRKHTKDVADLLKLNNIHADYYHAGLSNKERNTKQESWINNSTHVIVCTNAFGMGIDKPDVRVVVHYDVPDCIENYYQEAGRAGRDGKRSYAVLLYSKKELGDLHQQIDIRYPSNEEIKKVYTAIMNYLQVPAGSGEGMSFDFDLSNFSKLFKLNILNTTYAIKTLEQEELVQFNEVFFKPSTLVFTAERNELADFETEHSELEPLIKGLLRSYEGIFDFPCSISETGLSKFLRVKQEEIITGLVKLKNFGIVDYSPQKEKPQITLLQNRMYADNFTINLENHFKRKNEFEKRILAISDFILNTTKCRGILIGEYFNDTDIPDCKICDNCINQKNLHLPSGDFKKIAAHIYMLISKSELTAKELVSKSPSFRKEDLWKVLEFLLAEKKLLTTPEGLIHLKN